MRRLGYLLAVLISGATILFAAMGICMGIDLELKTDTVFYEVLFLASGCFFVLFAWLGLRRPRKTPPGKCNSCGYDLRATPDRCPECGKLVENAT
jgi:hypothetical protein